MLQFISKMHTIINQFKGFEAGYSTSNKNQMIIQMDNKCYKISIEALDGRNIEQHVDDL